MFEIALLQCGLVLGIASVLKIERKALLITLMQGVVMVNVIDWCCSQCRHIKRVRWAQIRPFSHEISADFHQRNH